MMQQAGILRSTARLDLRSMSVTSALWEGPLQAHAAAHVISQFQQMTEPMYAMCCLSRKISRAPAVQRASTSAWCCRWRPTPTAC